MSHFPRPLCRPLIGSPRGSSNTRHSMYCIPIHHCAPSSRVALHKPTHHTLHAPRGPTCIRQQPPQLSKYFKGKLIIDPSTCTTTSPARLSRLSPLHQVLLLVSNSGSCAGVVWARSWEGKLTRCIGGGKNVSSRWFLLLFELSILCFFLSFLSLQFFLVLCLVKFV